MSTPQDSLTAAALAGAATGARSFTGIAALVAVTAPDAERQPDRVLGRPVVKAVIGLAALQELIGDKLPQAPSRLEPLGLGARLVCAAACGVIAARRVSDQAADAESQRPGEPADSPDPRLPVACAAVAAACAGATAWLGRNGRRAGASFLGRDWPGAVLEDAVATGLAGAAASRLR